MIYLDEDVIDFAKKHKIDTDNARCAKCGREVKWERAFVTQRFYGIIGDVHECGEDYKISRAVLKSAVANLEVKGILNDLLD